MPGHILTDSISLTLRYQLCSHSFSWPPSLQNALRIRKQSRSLNRQLCAFDRLLHLCILLHSQLKFADGSNSDVCVLHPPRQHHSNQLDSDCFSFYHQIIEKMKRAEKKEIEGIDTAKDRGL